MSTGTQTAGNPLPSFAFDPSDPWTTTLQAGLARADLDGRRVYEVGVGTGANIAFMLQHCAASFVAGSDLDPRLPPLAQRLVGENTPDLLDRIRLITGSVGLIDAPAARAEAAVADVIVGCLPQVPDPGDALFRRFHRAYAGMVAPAGTMADVAGRSNDHMAHYYPWSAFDDHPFNTVGLGLNEALLRMVRACAPQAQVVLTFACRVPKGVLLRLFRAHGYRPEVLASRIVRQHARTGISFFIALESALRSTGHEHEFGCEFYLDPQGETAISATEAQRRLNIDPTTSVFHEICVLRGRPGLGAVSVGTEVRA